MHRLAPLLVLLMLGVVMSGCESSPLTAYESTAATLTAANNTMAELHRAEAIDRDTLQAYRDTLAAPAVAATLAWGQAIVAEYFKPRDERDYARLTHLAEIAKAAVKAAVTKQESLQ